MINLTKGKKNNFLLRREIFFSLILSCLFIVTVMCFTLLPVFTSTQQKTTTNYMTSQLKQITYSANVMFDEAKNVINTAYTDAIVRENMYADNVNRIKEAQVVERIRGIKSSHSYVNFIGFYNEKLDRYITTGGVFANLSDHKEYTDEILNKNNFQIYPRATGNSYPFTEEQLSVYTFNFTPDSSKEQDLKNFVTVDMNASYLQTLINRMSVNGENQTIMVVDDKGTIVSHTRNSYFLRPVSTMDFNEKLMQDEFQTEQGSFTYKDKNGKKNFLTFVKTPSNGWTYISTQPYNTVVQNTGFIIVMTCVLSLFLILLGFVYAKYMVKKIHNPIKKLYDTFATDENDTQEDNNHLTNEVEQLNQAFKRIVSKAQTMENSFNSSISVVRFTYLKFLIEGDLGRIDRSLNVYDELGIQLNSPYYVSVVIEYCDFMRFKADVTPKDQILYGYAIENISSELLLELTNTEFMHFSESRFAGILHLQTPELPHMLDEALQQIVDVMQKEFGCDVRACIGTIQDNYRKISRSFDDAKLAIKQRIAESDDNIIYATQVLQGPKVKQFPTSLQNKLVDHIRQLDEYAIASTIDEIMQYLQEISWSFCVDYTKQIMFNIMSKFDSVTQQKEQRQQDLLTIVKSTEGSQNFIALKSNTTAFVGLIVSYLSERKKDSSAQVVQKVKQYTLENFENTAITLNFMADMVGLTPAYFGRMFTSHCGISYIDYLNGVRLEEAAKILKTTNHPVSAVSEMVGISNSNYFYTIFKKKYEMTPAAFRKNL